jgi:hypothetical protein
MCTYLARYEIFNPIEKNIRYHNLVNIFLKIPSMSLASIEYLEKKFALAWVVV